MSTARASIRRAAEHIRDDAEVLERVAAAELVTVGDAAAAGLAALERRARDLIAGNLGSTPDGRRAAMAYLHDIERWAVRRGDPYIVSFAPRPRIHVAGRIARVRGLDTIRRDVAYWQVEGDVLRSELFAEVGRRLPADVALPPPARALAQAPADPISAIRDGDRSTSSVRMG